MVAHSTRAFRRDGPAVSEDTQLLFSEADGLALDLVTSGQPQAGAEVDAGGGSGSDLPQAQCQQSCGGTQDIRLLAEGDVSRQGQTGLSGKHHLPAYVAGIPP